jgi:hypothetical protein
MSIPTNYITLNQNTSSYQDLSEIFQPLLPGGTSILYDTGYKVGSTDLSKIFASLDGGTSIGYDTGYKVGSTDLSKIFAPYLPFTVTGSGTYSYNYSNGYYSVIFNTPNTNTISFNNNINNVYTIIIGGGGSGGSSLATPSTYTFYGTGGGGGGICILKSNVTNGNGHNISVGSGASGVAQGLNGNNGNSSIVTISGISYPGSGGSGGQHGAVFSSKTSFLYNPLNGGSGGSGGSGGTGPSIGSPVIFSGSGGNGGNGGEKYSNLNSSNGLYFSMPGRSSDYYYSQNIINIPTTLNGYGIINGGGGGGAASVGGLGGSLGQGGLQSNSTIGSGTQPGGGGGASNTSSTSGAGANGLVAYYFQYPVVTNNYFTSYTGLYSIIYDSGYCYINFFTSGTLTISTRITNAIIVCVGGGGGGGGKVVISSSVNGAGSGGGGGGAGVITSQTINSGPYTITVGTGGLGGATPGNTGSQGNFIPGTNGTNSSFGSTIRCSGGTGGRTTNITGSLSPTQAGTVIIPRSGYIGGSGGSGGAGQFGEDYVGNPGVNSNIYNYTSSGSNGYQLPNKKFIYFSGGGGGGKDGFSAVGLGGYSGNGIGGGQGTIGGVNSNSYTQQVSWPYTNVPLYNPPYPLFTILDTYGKNGVLYGSGGGGCGGDNGGPGGNGGTGLVSLIFPFPIT